MGKPAFALSVDMILQGEEGCPFHGHPEHLGLSTCGRALTQPSLHTGVWRYLCQTLSMCFVHAAASGSALPTQQHEDGRAGRHGAMVTACEWPVHPTALRISPM